MSYSSKREYQNVPVDHLSVRVEELHVHLGDILPAGTNYQGKDNVTVNLIVHYVDESGRDKRKTISFHSTGLL